MTEDHTKEEDVAAKLMGKVVCPKCDGSGVYYPEWSGSSYPDDQEIAEAGGEEPYDCPFCGGDRWVDKKTLRSIGFSW